MTERNKYNSSKIYKICSNKTNKIYIGSTTQTLAKRLYHHVSQYTSYNIDNSKVYVSSFEIIKLEDYYISLIEEHNYNNKQQLVNREGEIIKLNLNIVVNLQIAGRTLREWRFDNKEKIAEQTKQYDIINKDRVKEVKRQYRLLNKEKIAETHNQYNIVNKEKIALQTKQYRQDNAIIISERNKKTFICICGSSLRIRDTLQHNKCKKHIKYIEQTQAQPIINTNTTINTITNILEPNLNNLTLNTN